MLRICNAHVHLRRSAFSKRSVEPQHHFRKQLDRVTDEAQSSSICARRWWTGFNTPSRGVSVRWAVAERSASREIQTMHPPEAVQMHRESCNSCMHGFPPSQSTDPVREEPIERADLSPGAHRMPTCHAIPGISNRTLDLFPCRRPAMLGCLLAQQLGSELRRVGSGQRMTFGAGEQTRLKKAMLWKHRKQPSRGWTASKRRGSWGLTLATV